ncbi:hypothetical protein PBY51_001527 [Eleginops maclovinus]|uniref:Ig-like domain-containing protein n=1 Tax=Eleginops maclovinus TaxID=56733 RepID=A0AAN7WZY4_ELEMC|nr:hypothetical protein PBY51_001527 [Eleginops maclovinus]
MPTTSGKGVSQVAPMKGITHLLLLAAFVLLGGCDGKPQVSISPAITDIYTGDLIYLKCSDKSNVIWYFNENKTDSQTSDTWKIGVASQMNSGSYRCESGGQKSDALSITVKAYIPVAKLSIKTGQPEMQEGSSVVLVLENRDGLSGWKCWVNRGPDTKKIVLRLKNDSVSLDFQPRQLLVRETIFWCSDDQQRSNQITVRTSDKSVALEMYPVPAVVGETLTLQCLVWGTNLISNTIFFKDNNTLSNSNSPIYTFSNVSKSDMGSYSCKATYTYIQKPAGEPYQQSSDNQDMLIQEPTEMRAVLSPSGTFMSCSCPNCPSQTSYHWYKKSGHNCMWTSEGQTLYPDDSGPYVCEAAWKNGRTPHSKVHKFISGKPSMMPLILSAVMVVLGILVLVAVFLYRSRRKRNTTGPIYEDLPMNPGEDKYQVLQKGPEKEAEYDLLQTEATGGQMKRGEYEALNKDEMKGGVYHTVKIEGAVGAEGGYEALKKDEMKGGVYHTVKIEGAVGAEGGYEALKKDEMKGGEYHTVKIKGEVGAEGGYEALKKEGMTGGEYHTVRIEGASGGEGGYEALQKEGMKEGEYQTLGMEDKGESKLSKKKDKD